MRAAIGGGALPRELRGQTSVAFMHLADWLPTLGKRTHGLRPCTSPSVVLRGRVFGRCPADGLGFGCARVVAAAHVAGVAAVDHRAVAGGELGDYNGVSLWPAWLALAARPPPNQHTAAAAAAVIAGAPVNASEWANRSDVLAQGTRLLVLEHNEQLLDPSAVKRAYRKSLIAIHPDKQDAADIEKKVLAQHIFDTLRDAWNLFEKTG